MLDEEHEIQNALEHDNFVNKVDLMQSLSYVICQFLQLFFVTLLIRFQKFVSKY